MIIKLTQNGLEIMITLVQRITIVKVQRIMANHSHTVTF